MNDLINFVVWLFLAVLVIVLATIGACIVLTMLMAYVAAFCIAMILFAAWYALYRLEQWLFPSEETALRL